MSSASAGSISDNSGEKNYAQVPDATCASCGHPTPISCTSAVSAEAEQGDGPAAASASSSAVGSTGARTSAVSVCVGAEYAAAACDFGAVAVGPHTAAAVGKLGAVAVGPGGSASSGDPADPKQVEATDQGTDPADRPGVPGEQGERS